MLSDWSSKCAVHATGRSPIQGVLPNIQK